VSGGGQMNVIGLSLENLLERSECRAAHLRVGRRDLHGSSGCVSEKKDEEHRREQGGARVAEQYIGIAESHNAASRDSCRRSLADGSRHVLNRRSRAAFFIRNMVHEKAVNTRARHPLHAAVGEIVGDGKGNAMRDAHAEE
jgi:hypothetical protein